MTLKGIKALSENFTKCFGAKGIIMTSFHHGALFVFSINGLKQNARSLLTPVSHPDFYALSHGSIHFGLYAVQRRIEIFT